MRGENGIVVKSVTRWLRRRGWICVPPSGVGEIAGVCGVSSSGRARGAARDEFEPIRRACVELEREYPELRLPPGSYC